MQQRKILARIIAGILCIFISTSATYANDFAVHQQLQQIFEIRITNHLSTYLGNKQFIVVVEIDFNTTSSTNKNNILDIDKTLLPGLPETQSLTVEQQQLNNHGQVNIKTIKVKLTVSDNITQAQRTDIENIVKAAIGYIQSRGDKVTIQTKNFNQYTIGRWLDENLSVLWIITAIFAVILLTLLWLFKRKLNSRKIELHNTVNRPSITQEEEKKPKNATEKGAVNATDVFNIDAIKESIVHKIISKKDLVSHISKDYLEDNRHNIQMLAALYQTLGQELFTHIFNTQLNDYQLSKVQQYDSLTLEIRSGLVSNFYKQILLAEYQDNIKHEAQHNPTMLINSLNHKQIAFLLQDASLTTQATLLASIDSEKAGKVVANLKVKSVPQLLMHISQISSLSKQNIRAAIDNISDKLAHIPQFDDVTIDSMELITNILGNLPDQTEKSIIEILKQYDEELYNKISRNYITFESIYDLATRDLKNILREVPHDILAIAIYDIDKKHQQELLNNLGSRQQKMVASDILAMQKPDEQEIQDAQHFIAKIARQSIRAKSTPNKQSVHN